MEMKNHRMGCTPQKNFRIPLLEALYWMGGSASTEKVRAKLREMMAGRLTPRDHQIVSSGQERWWNRVCFERADLVREGLFRNDSPRGVWELSLAGFEYVENYLIRRDAA